MAFERNGLKVNLKKTKVMVSGLKGEVLMIVVDPCAKSGKRMMANSVMCTKCGKWVHGRRPKMKRVISLWQKILFVNYVLKQWMELWSQANKYHS